jgi:type III secretion system chaperone YscW
LKTNKIFFLLPILTLVACTHTSSIKKVFSSNSQALLHGWLILDKYVAPVNTYVEVELCQVKENECMTVAKQKYQGVQLPVKYSFVVAPIQAGKGEMKVRALLTEQGNLIARAEEKYTFVQGDTQRNLRLKFK